MSSKNKNNIICRFHSDNDRAFYITENLKVLPCCYYASLDLAGKFLEKNEGDFTLDNLDPIFAEQSKLDPNWNDIASKSLEEIMENKIYKHHLFHDGWNSDNPSKICVYHCTNSLKKIK